MINFCIISFCLDLPFTARFLVQVAAWAWNRLDIDWC